MNIECSSTVARVVVHARGALVTREISLPADLADGVVDVAVPDITVMAEPGSARACLEDSERVVSAVHAKLVVPGGASAPGPTLTRVRELTRRASRFADEHRVLVERRARLIALAVVPRVQTSDTRKRERDALDVRFGEALKMNALLHEKLGRIDERLLTLETESFGVSREIEAARLEDNQASTKRRMGTDEPTRTITARLTGSGRPGRLLVTYAVAAARWWPVYTLRVENGGARATWTFEAVLAQKSGEDWSGVTLALSSADLVFDARLPELASLRFGRAHASDDRRRAFRPAPSGVDDMFAAYLAFGVSAFRASAPPQPGIGSRSSPVERGSSGRGESSAFAAPSAAVWPEALQGDEGDSSAEETAVHTRMDDIVSDERAKKLRRAPPPPPHGAPPPSAAIPAPMMSLQQMVPRRALRAAAGDMFGSAGGTVGLSSKSAPLEAEPELVPSEAWSDHDALVLANADDSRRGRLVPSSAGSGDARAIEQAVHAVDEAGGDRYRDPLETRGMFDHRYEAAGRADVPSDGRIHRVAVGKSACTARIAWRTVPSEGLDVYREAEVQNPFETGLLGGPVDVYLDGSLLTTTRVDRIDRRGTLICGMGVDPRFKVARNVRVDEESAGLLGGSTAVTHTVDVELSSTVSDPVRIAVLERVPVTDDKALEVKIVSANPHPTAYDQADRGAPVRGGCLFEVGLAPGKKSGIQIVYRLVFAQKLDIVGGSRRD